MIVHGKILVNGKKVTIPSYCLKKKDTISVNIKNAELDQIGEPKDEINVIVGDDKQTEFFPQVKLQRF